MQERESQHKWRLVTPQLGTAVVVSYPYAECENCGLQVPPYIDYAGPGIAGGNLTANFPPTAYGVCKP